MKTAHYTPGRVWKLPPLILHPFSDVTSPQKLVQGSRASLMLQGLLPNEANSTDDLQRTLLDGRFCEIRMLFYIGKDLVRWVEQCTELVNREPALQLAGVTWQSFAELAIQDPPDSVREKLRLWGVADFRTIFARAIGFNAIFADIPERTTLTDEFIRDYHRFADGMFAIRQAAASYVPIRSADFNFDLYASGEYSRMLEQQWQ